MACNWRSLSFFVGGLGRWRIWLRVPIPIRRVGGKLIIIIHWAIRNFGETRLEVYMYVSYMSWAAKYTRVFYEMYRHKHEGKSLEGELAVYNTRIIMLYMCFISRRPLTDRVINNTEGTVWLLLHACTNVTLTTGYKAIIQHANTQTH